MERNKIYNMECIAGMSGLPPRSVDMILCDLPYGVTDCQWDKLLPLNQLWEQYLRIIKEDGAIVLTACQPFTIQLIMSQRKLFRYCWYWRKNCPTGFANAKRQPLRCIEDVVVFYRRPGTYHPQGLRRLATPLEKKAAPKAGGVYKAGTLNKPHIQEFTAYPRNLLEVPCERGLHPTQKPAALFEYLVRTYTDPGELVLDNCIGSGTTAVACIRSGRDYLGFELDPHYCAVARRRAEKEREESTRCPVNPNTPASTPDAAP